MEKVPSNPEPKPDFSVEWDGSTANVYGFQAILEAAHRGSVVVYDRSDFPAPIERATIECAISEAEMGEPGLALTATFRLARYQRTPSLVQRHEFIERVTPYNKKVGGFVFRPIDTDPIRASSNVIHVRNSNGASFLLWENGDGTILVGNSLASDRKNASGNPAISQRPPALHTLEPEAIFESFMQLFMMSADKAVGLYDGHYYDRGQKLSKTYEIGRSIGPKRTFRQIGKAATQAEPREENPENGTGLESLEFDIHEGKVSLDDVGGLSEVKKTLHDVATSFLHAEVMEKWGAHRPLGILMYGEPGTGKTMLVEALGTEIGAEVWHIQSTDVYEKWLGNSEQNIKALFARIRQVEKPTILFFDELDAIIGITDSPNSGGADNARNAVAAIFKQEMNTLAEENPNVLIAAATNNLDRIEPSLIRSGRFDYKIYVPMPDEEARVEIVTNIVAKAMLSKDGNGFKVFADDIDTPRVAKSTDGMSGADITEIFRRLRLEKAMAEARGAQTTPIDQAEIEGAVNSFRTRG